MEPFAHLLETFTIPILQACVLLFISPGNNQPTYITISLKKGTSTLYLLTFQNTPAN